MNARMRTEVIDRLIDAHHQYIADASAFVLHGERVVIEATPAAAVTNDAHVGQEAHLDLTHALPFAGIAPAAGGVERESRRRVTAHARFRRFGEHFTNGVPE